MNKLPTVNIGICGLGTVGQGVWKHLSRARADFASRLGLRVEVRRAAVRNPGKVRAVAVPAAKICDDALAVATDPAIHIVCELMGGTGLARKSDPGRACPGQDRRFREQGAHLRARRRNIRHGGKARRTLSF